MSPQETMTVDPKDNELVEPLNALNELINNQIYLVNSGVRCGASKPTLPVDCRR